MKNTQNEPKSKKPRAEKKIASPKEVKLPVTKPKKKIPLITFGQFQADLSAIKEKIDKAWSYEREEELKKRLATIHALISADEGIPAGKPVVLDSQTALSRRATGAIQILNRWAAKFSA